jgi:putative addiction module component (TIGR02574 family)
MASRLPDFSHLTPAERIELAEQLWDSLPVEAVGPDEAQIAELRRRRASLADDRNPGEPWRRALDEIENGRPWIMLQLCLREEARTDLAEAFHWYETRRAGLGSEFLQSVRLTLSLIERNPAIYPIAVDDIRKAPLKRFPYITYYVVTDDQISVLAVMHGRRDPQRWQERR